MIRRYIGLPPYMLEQRIFARCRDQFPEWLTTASRTNAELRELVYGIVSQYARGWNARDIAEWWEVPVQFVYAIKKTRAPEIKAEAEDLIFCREAAKRCIANMDESGTTLNPAAVKTLMNALARAAIRKEK